MGRKKKQRAPVGRSPDQIEADFLAILRSLHVKYSRTSIEVAAETGISRPVIRRSLGRLRDRGHINSAGSKAATRWLLSEAGAAVVAASQPLAEAAAAQ